MYIRMDLDSSGIPVDPSLSLEGDAASPAHEILSYLEESSCTSLLSIL